MQYLVWFAGFERAELSSLSSRFHRFGRQIGRQKNPGVSAPARAGRRLIAGGAPYASLLQRGKGRDCPAAGSGPRRPTTPRSCGFSPLFENTDRTTEGGSGRQEGLQKTTRYGQLCGMKSANAVLLALSETVASEPSRRRYDDSCMAQGCSVLLFILVTLLVVFFFRRWRLLDELIEELNNFGGGPRTPMHPSNSVVTIRSA